MDQETRDFFDKVLQKVAPSLLEPGRKAILDSVVYHTIGHPWADSNLVASMSSNLARDLGMEDQLPEDLKDETEQGDDDDE